MRKKVAVLSSSRADFNYLRLILKKISASNELDLSLLITGTHLLEKYGMTKKFIEIDNIPITKTIDMYDPGDLSKVALGKAVGKGIINFTIALNDIKPDLLLVLGDRYEILAVVIAASTLRIPIAHIHGGDNVSYGQVDEQIRHAITKFAHIHFPATSKSAERIRLFGEEEWRIHMVGSPSIDHIYQEKFASKTEICTKLGLSDDLEILVCILHPYTIESEKAGEQMGMILKILKDFGFQSVILYPNNDPGSDLIINEIQQNIDNPNFKIFKNLSYYDYYSLLSNANLLIGNSSSGLIESPILKLPVVNIGDRNKGRESAENVINVPYDANLIKEAIKKGMTPEFKKKCEKVINPYGDGKASERIVKIIEDLKIDKNLLIKKLTFNV
ncbi:MAG: UDP-N-acetylglucosamine 2-epimerase [Candidatus Thorarchaeota archaeon]